jgi:rRNA-processing protein FCF1
MGDILSLTNRYVSKGIIVDTNVFLLYLAVKCDRRFARSWTRIQDFEEKDYDLIVTYLGPFVRQIVTPQIIAEVSNLWPNYELPRDKAFIDGAIELIVECSEHHTRLESLVENRWLSRIGFTDVSICEAARRLDYLVLSTDFELVGRMEKDGLPVVNFNHLRPLDL